MLNKNFKKYMSLVTAAFCVVSSPFTAFCSKDSKEINDQKKPFKNCNFSQIQFGDKTTTFAPPFNKYYKNNFLAAEEIMKDSPFVLRIGKDFKSFIPPEVLKLFMKHYSVVVIESGVVGADWFARMISTFYLNHDKTIWKKEILPLNDFCEDKEDVFERGYRLVITNTKNNKKIIFNFELGKTISKSSVKVYGINCEINKYNSILDCVLSINPTSPNGLLPKKLSKYEIKNFYVIDGIKNINRSCFSCSSSLVTINFLGEIETLGELAFNKCMMLKNVNFSKCVKHVGDKAFDTCHSLERIEFPEGLISLGSHVFKDCFNLKYIVLPDSLEMVCIDTFSFVPKDVKIIYKGQEICKKNFLRFFIDNGGKIKRSKVKSKIF